MPRQDITFCMTFDCKHKWCERNPKNIKDKKIPHSFANFEYTDLCAKSYETVKQGKKDKEGENATD